MKEITSSANPRYRFWSQLLGARGLKKEGRCLVMGDKILRDLDRARGPFEIIVTKDHLESHAELIESFPGAELNLLPSDLFSRLDTFGTETPLVSAPLPEVGVWDESQPPLVDEILVATQDPGNLGTIARTALAFHIRRLVLLTECAHPFLPRSLRASSGAMLKLELLRGPSIHELKAPCLALDLHGTNLFEFKWPKAVRLLVGEEGRGVPEGINCTRLTLPISQEVDSLNAAAAVTSALTLMAQSRI